MARLIAFLLLFPSIAWADPISVTVFFAQMGMGSVGVFLANYGATILTGALLAHGVYQSERAKKKARDAYNRSLQDRLINVRSAVSTRKYVLGTIRTGGTLLYADTIGENQVALDSVTAYAANTTSLVGWYLGDEYVSAAAFPGEKYSARKTLRGYKTVSLAAGTQVVALGDTPVTGTVAAQIGLGEVATAVTVVSVSGASVTLDVPSPGGAVNISYSYLGAAKLYGTHYAGLYSQTSSPWGANYPSPKWGASHRVRGTTLARTLMLWDEDVYQSGAPNVGMVLTGIGIANPANGSTWYPYDPRTGNPVMTGTTNPALLAAWWATLPRSQRGMGIPSDWIDWDSVAAAANVCDETISVKKLDGSGYENIKRYECNTILDTANSPVENRNIILSAMAGSMVFTAGKYRIFAGAFRPATLTVTDDMVIGTEPITVVKGANDEAPPNVITSTIADASKHWQETSPPQVRNAAYILADGGERAVDLPLPATTDSRQANYLMGVELERRRPAFTCMLHMNGAGEDVALGDTLEIDLTNRSQYAGKTFEVVKIIDKWNGTFDVQLVEMKSTSWTLDADRFVPIVQPLPPDTSYLWNVAALTGFDVLDGQTSDGIEIAWDLHSQGYVRDGGHIEMRYRELGSDWRPLPSARGDSTGTTLTIAVLRNATYEFQARAVNPLGATSAWAYEFATVVVSIPGSALTSIASHGMSITPDPGIEDPSLWVLHTGTWPERYAATVGSSYTFGKYLWRASALADIYTKPVPVDKAKAYRAIAYALRDAVGDTCTMYLYVRFFDTNGATIYSAGSTWPAEGAYNYFGLLGAVPPTSTKVYEINFGAGQVAQIPANARYMSIGALMNYSGAGKTYFAGRIQQLQDTELIAPNAATDVLVIRTAGYTVDGSNSGGYYGVRTSPSTGTQSAPDLAWTNDLGETVDVIVRGSASMSVWVHASNPAPHVRHGFVGIYSADATGLPIALLDLKTAVTTPAVAGTYAGSGAPSYSTSVAAGQTVRYNLYCNADGAYGGIRPVGYAVSDGQLTLEVIKR
jgi:hypothetical protein